MPVQWPQMCVIYFQRNVFTISHWNWSLKVKFEEKYEKCYWLPYHPVTGNYSRLACEFQFVRSMGYYLIQIYIPSSLIVVISWVSFWLNRGATPARVGLGVTTVLTMTTLISSTNSALPKISYVKSIDVYLAACFFMVFFSLIGRSRWRMRWHFKKQIQHGSDCSNI